MCGSYVDMDIKRVACSCKYDRIHLLYFLKNIAYDSYVRIKVTDSNAMTEGSREFYRIPTNS